MSFFYVPRMRDAVEPGDIQYPVTVEYHLCGESPLPIILPVNVLANHCGFFSNYAYNQYGPVINNGYNCCHPDQNEGEEVNGHWIGACCRKSCPIAYPTGYGDLVEYGIIKSVGENDSKELQTLEADGEYMTVTDISVAQRLLEAGVTGSARRCSV